MLTEIVSDQVTQCESGQTWHSLTLTVDGVPYNADAVKTAGGNVSIYSMWRNGGSTQTRRRSAVRVAIESAIREHFGQ